MQIASLPSSKHSAFPMQYARRQEGSCPCVSLGIAILADKKPPTANHTVGSPNIALTKTQKHFSPIVMTCAVAFSMPPFRLCIKTSIRPLHFEYC